MALDQYLGLLAGIFQVVAYLVYIRYFLKDAIRPNPLSWLMFAYGTALMVFLEWQGGASANMLILPVACSTMSIVIAGLCLRSRIDGPSTAIDKAAFGADVGLTFGYLGARSMFGSGIALNSGFIVAGNLTTITAFMPILWSTWKNPQDEKVAPWLFWSLAYALLLASTVLSVGMSAPSLLVYPALNLIIHGVMVCLIVRKPKMDQQTRFNNASVFVAPSPIAGNGIFARRDFAVGEHIVTLTGEHIVKPSPFAHHPNWVGIDHDEWIDPQYPVSYLNHNCEPNAAFSNGHILRALRPIARNEEVTMDYSTTEADLGWRMDCACGVQSCRRTLTAIQTAFELCDAPPPALPRMQEIWHAWQAKLGSKAA